MLPKKSLKQIPSHNKFVEFKEFTNEYHELMMNTQDSVTDNIYTQITILEDACEYDINELTILDVFTIFLHWRYRCVGSDLELNDEGVVTKINLEHWFNYLDVILKIDSRKYINTENFSLIIDVPKYTDVKDLYNEAFHITDEDGKYGYIHEKLNTYCYIQKIDIGDGWIDVHNYDQKKRIFDSLPNEVYIKVMDHVKHINNSISKLNFSFKVKNTPAKINIPNIPHVIKMLFLCDSESYHEKLRFLMKRRNLSYEYLSQLMPTSFDKTFYSVIDEEKDAQAEQKNETPISPYEDMG